MKKRNNSLLQGNAANQFRAQPTVRQPPHMPGIMQPKMAAASQMKRPPVAPPVYRPELA